MGRIYIAMKFMFLTTQNEANVRNMQYFSIASLTCIFVYIFSKKKKKHGIQIFLSAEE